VFNSPMLHLLRVEMVINSPSIMPILGTKELASPEQTAPDLLRILFKNQSSRYVVPTGRVIVLTGRYIVPTGRVIVTTGRYVVPAVSTICDPLKDLRNTLNRKEHQVSRDVIYMFNDSTNVILHLRKLHSGYLELQEAHARIKDLEDEIAEQANEENLSTSRNEGLEVDRTMADHDAKALFKVGEKRLGTDEKIFSHFQWKK
nr:annexin D5-like [Tanacetum cinerariifolium]